jgi:hypothetical protein
MRRVLALALGIGIAAVPSLLAQQPGGPDSSAVASAKAEGPQPRTQASARDAAPIDLTGYWVSYVTENWRYRMVTPAKGEYRRIPASPAALPLINGWDPAADEKAGNQCKSYGAGAIMNVPGRLRITWQDANTLRIDTDAGTQTRRLSFAAAKPVSAKAAAPSWQGESSARWEPAQGGGGSLRVVTTNLRAGYLRKNGVPYSDRATVTEHFDLTSLPGVGQLLLVNTVVDDPVYLTGPYVTSPHFKKEPDGSKWDPTPCSSTW